MLKFLKRDIGRIIISIIWGFGLATLFRKICKGKNCIILKAPEPKEIKKKYINLIINVINLNLLM